MTPALQRILFSPKPAVVASGGATLILKTLYEALGTGESFNFNPGAVSLQVGDLLVMVLQSSDGRAMTQTLTGSAVSLTQVGTNQTDGTQTYRAYAHLLASGDVSGGSSGKITLDAGLSATEPTQVQVWRGPATTTFMGFQASSAAPTTGDLVFTGYTPITDAGKVALFIGAVSSSAGTETVSVSPGSWTTIYNAALPGTTGGFFHQYSFSFGSYANTSYTFTGWHGAAHGGFLLGLN